MITLIYLILHLRKTEKKTNKKENGKKLRRDPHKIANKVPHVLIAHFLMFYK